MKSLNIDVILPWEVGLVLVVIGTISIVIGVKQGKKELDDLNKIPLIKPTTKLLLGSFLSLFGLIQMLPLLGNF